jgi:L,D-transpeptidase YbiS
MTEPGKFKERYNSSREFRMTVNIITGSGLLILTLLICYSFVLHVLPAAMEGGARLLPVQTPDKMDIIDSEDSSSDQIKITGKKIDELRKKLEKQLPKTPYLVVNTTQNRFFMYSGRKLVREGICSTGSYTLLVKTNEQKGDEQKWIFRTPKGIFRIREKKTAPVWKKPDWAFIEEGLPVPSANHPSRYEYGTLGDYALSLGDGYMIHGTLYQRFLGMPVTHGCIRLGDADLEAVYKTLSTGAKVYIY